MSSKSVEKTEANIAQLLRDCLGLIQRNAELIHYICRTRDASNVYHVWLLQVHSPSSRSNCQFDIRPKQ